MALPCAHAQDTNKLIEYQFRIVNSYPHSRQVFTQGLEFHNNLLYESGGQYGQSSVLIRKLDSVVPLYRRRLNAAFFAEGITVLDDKLYQLTWRSGKGFIYHSETLEPLGQFRVPGEGWGLCNDGSQLIISDGTERIRFIEPDTLKVSASLEVTFAGRPLKRLNELEWIDGKIYANVWQSNWIVIIDPLTGKVTGKINLTSLLPESLRDSSTDVLNGIAYDHAGKRLFVTGKNWPKLYHIELTALHN